MANDRIEFSKSGMLRFPEREPGAPRLGCEVGDPPPDRNRLGHGPSRPGTRPWLERGRGDEFLLKGPCYGDFPLLDEDNDDIRRIDLTHRRPSSVDARSGDRSLEIRRLGRLRGRRAAAGHGGGGDRRDRTGHPLPHQVRLYPEQVSPASGAAPCATHRRGPREVLTATMILNVPAGISDQLGLLPKST